MIYHYLLYVSYVVLNICDQNITYHCIKQSY